MIDYAKFLPPTMTEEESYNAGYDCGMNGANTSNCHFSFFSTPNKTKQWEKGKLKGEFDKAKQKSK